MSLKSTDSVSIKILQNAIGTDAQLIVKETIS